MATTFIRDLQVMTYGELPQTGSKAPGFVLVNNDFSTSTLDQFRGSKVLLNIFPSIETSVCSASVRRFNLEAAGFPNAKILCISRDLPFTQKKFCAAEGIENVITLSDFETGNFGKDYGLLMLNGSMKGLLARAVVIIDEQGIVCYTQLVPSIGQEPDYGEALKNL